MWRRVVLSIAVGLATLLLLIAPRPAHADDYSYARVVRLSHVEGDVQISRSGQDGWEVAIANMPIEQGFVIGTNDGRAAIEFESGATAYIAQNTVVQFTELALANGGRVTRITITQGTATFSANLTSSDSFAILTPQIQVTIPQCAEVRVDVFNDGSSASVLQGTVSVESPAGTREVSKGRTLAFSSAAPDQVAEKSNPKADDWDHWVDAGENSLSYSATQTQQYTSAPFQYGLADLTQYGNWNYFSGYGYGWQPFGCSPGWSPFVNGIFLYYHGLGWTWISAEPWGWVPYHFGNWILQPGCGWFWFPGNINGYNNGFAYWCPAPVHWVRKGRHIGWTPIQPGTPMGQRITPIILSDMKKIGDAGKVKVVDGGGAEIMSGPPGRDGKFGAERVSKDKVFSSVSPSSTLSQGDGVAATLVPSNPSVLPPGAGIQVIPPPALIRSQRIGMPPRVGPPMVVPESEGPSGQPRIIPPAMPPSAGTPGPVRTVSPQPPPPAQRIVPPPPQRIVTPSPAPPPRQSSPPPQSGPPPAPAPSRPTSPPQPPPQAKPPAFSATQPAMQQYVSPPSAAHTNSGGHPK